MTPAEMTEDRLGMRPLDVSGVILESNLDLTVFVACYNEEAHIVDTLNTLVSAFHSLTCTWEILVIDDASSDRSVERVQQYIHDHPTCRIILKIRQENVGLAQNYIEAAFLGRGRHLKLVSGDNAEPKETLVTVLSHMGQADIIIPYFVAVEGRTMFRHLLSRLYTLLVNTISGYRIRYYNGAAVHLRYNVMRWHTNYHGFSFQADIITRLLDQGMSYREVAAVAQDRKAGISKALTLRNFLSVSHFLVDLIIRRVGRSSRHKVTVLK